MNTNELRIGNLFIDQLTGSLLMVTELTEKNVIFFVLDRNGFPLPDGWKAQPIPITHEWLKKVGFSNDERLSISVNSSDELCYCNLGSEYSIRYQTKGAGFTRDYDIKYIHQLQNLYFALTGKELII